MNQIDKLFYKTVTEVIPALECAKSSEYEEIKYKSIQKTQGASEAVKQFIKVLFEITDEKRNEVSHE